MSGFKGIEQAIKYAKGKSSSTVFAEAHRRDYLEEYNQALKDSLATEMLEMLKRCEYWIQNCSEEAKIIKDINALIKKATE